MADKHLVCESAICKCDYGAAPDKLVVRTQTLRYINDNGAQKLIGTDKDLGVPFQKGTFGTCAKKNGGPCVPAITKWEGFYEKITLEDNGGHALLEDSVATCAVAGTGCVRFLHHGQTAAVGGGAVAKANRAKHAELNPAVNLEEVEEAVDETPEAW